MDNIEDFRNYCLTFKGVKERFPFDKTTLVFSVMNKMFCLVDIDNFEFCNLKCDPNEAEDLRAHYKGIKAGYHMSKAHWNSVYFNSDVPSDLIKEMVTNSYNLVVKSLKKTDKALLESL